jgi:hypothetical protein
MPFATSHTSTTLSTTLLHHKNAPFTARHISEKSQGLRGGHAGYVLRVHNTNPYTNPSNDPRLGLG